MDFAPGIRVRVHIVTVSRSREIDNGENSKRVHASLKLLTNAYELFTVVVIVLVVVVVVMVVVVVVLLYSIRFDSIRFDPIRDREFDTRTILLFAEIDSVATCFAANLLANVSIQPALVRAL